MCFCADICILFGACRVRWGENNVRSKTARAWPMLLHLLVLLLLPRLLRQRRGGAVLRCAVRCGAVMVSLGFNQPAHCSQSLMPCSSGPVRDGKQIFFILFKRSASLCLSWAGSPLSTSFRRLPHIIYVLLHTRFSAMIPASPSTACGFCSRLLHCTVLYNTIQSCTTRASDCSKMGCSKLGARA